VGDLAKARIMMAQFKVGGALAKARIMMAQFKVGEH